MTRSSNLPTLKVDGGALLFERPQPNPRELEQAKLAGEGLVAAYNQMGYDAVGVTRLDLLGGLDFLKSLAGRAKFAWLSANLVEPGSGKPLFTPFISRKLGDTKVAIIGITSDQLYAPGLPNGPALIIKPWAEALTPLLAELGRSHDFLILLTDLPPTVCGTVARQFPALNLIINASGDTANQPPRTLGPTTLLTATGRQGKYTGALEIAWSPGGRWGEGESQSLALRDKLAELQRTTGQLTEIAGRPEQESQAGNLQRRQLLLQQEIAGLRTALTGVPVAFFSSTFQAMNAAMGEEPGVAAIVAQVKERIADQGRKEAAATGVSSPLPDFSGWQVCGSCHPKAAARWQGTKHAGAYLTLEKKKRQFSADCLLCHVTGGEVASTDRLATLPPELRGVGCEVCHGPGRRHAEGQEKSRPRRVPETLCRNCHVPEHDGHFDYVRKLEMIRCDR
ncbi:MAG: hypothetical protein HGA96_06345 [Desulfobulbaceae bacterium]|nr:hypothetical protein [Desulfobulbaceae bacterium]